MSAVLLEILFILLLLSTTTSGQDHLPQRGECGTLKKDYYYNQKNMTQIDEFPWMGVIYYHNKTENLYYYHCQAVLISKWFLISAAGCFEFKMEPIAVFLGDWNKKNDRTKSDCDDRGICAPVPKRYNIEDIIKYPNINVKAGNLYGNSINLIKLSEPVVYSDYIRPICLPSKDITPMNFDNELLELTGWYTNNNNPIKSKAYVRVLKLNNCEKRLEGIFSVNKTSNMCAFSCWGDFVFAYGSVLMGTTVLNEEPVNYYLLGMNIYGQATCSPRNPHVYIRIDRFLDWIHENTKIETSLIMPRKANS